MCAPATSSAERLRPATASRCRQNPSKKSQSTENESFYSLSLSLSLSRNLGPDAKKKHFREISSHPNSIPNGIAFDVVRETKNGNDPKVGPRLALSKGQTKLTRENDVTSRGQLVPLHK